MPLINVTPNTKNATGIYSLSSSHSQKWQCLLGHELLNKLLQAKEHVSGQPTALAIKNPLMLLQTLSDLVSRNHPIVLLNPNLPEAQQIKLASQLGCQNLYTDEQQQALAASSTLSPMESAHWTICSSGTSSPTGTPKSYGFKLQQSLDNAKAHMTSLGFDPQTSHRILLPLPITHTFGMVAGVLGSLQYNADLFIANYGISAQGIMQEAIEHNIDSIYLTPPQVIQLNTLLKRRPNIPKPQLQRISIGSAPVLASELLKLMAHFPNTDFYTTYGLTEMGPRVSTFYAGIGSDPNSVLLEQPNQVTPLGNPLPGVELKVEDQRLWIKSTYQAINLGQGDSHCYDTQDQCLQDENGNIRVPGRADDTIIRSGINIFPHEIEALLTGIEPLQATCMIATPSRAYGQIPVLVCQVEEEKIQDDTSTMEQEILARLQDAVPATHMPARIVFRNQLPRTSLGKIQRNLLAREIMGTLHGEH